MSAMVDQAVSPSNPQVAVLAAAHRCVDLLVRTAVIGRDDTPTWPAWKVGPDGVATGVVGGNRSLYAGDPGVVWALSHLGEALGRADAVELAASGREALIGSDGEDPASGLLVGQAGVDLLASLRAVGVSGSSGFVGSVGPVAKGWSDGCDLTDGLAGILLSLARADRHEAHAAAIVAELRHRSHVELWGRSWPDARLGGEDARPLCGLSHGASGIAWALTEAAAVWPGLADNALSLAADALAWEDSWSDPARGGWPDLREGETAWPDLWCHGSAGAGAVRLRMLELAAAGLEVPWSLDTTRAEAEMAVQRCGQSMVDAQALIRTHGRVDVLEAGLTLCHGLGGALGVVALAADVLDTPDHRTGALQVAQTFVEAAPLDPEEWPCGLRGADGDVSLLTGVAGTAVVLADLAQPGSVPSLALLGMGGARSASGGPGPGVLATGGRSGDPRVAADAPVATVSHL